MRLIISFELATRHVTELHILFRITAESSTRVSVVSLLPEPIYRPRQSEGQEKPGETVGTTSQNLAALVGPPLLSH
jgi:hypothetical protein